MTAALNITDRELLELAAKAAGIVGTFDRDCIRVAAPAHGEGWHTCWNPLGDDGDALRLAVRLDLNIRQIAGSTVITRHETHLATEHHGDAAERTRRAIVRAAAEIGRALP